jgi:hypothetical protein
MQAHRKAEREPQGDQRAQSLEVGNPFSYRQVTLDRIPFAVSIDASSTRHKRTNSREWRESAALDGVLAAQSLIVGGMR